MGYLILLLIGVVAGFILTQYRLNEKNIIPVFDPSEPSKIELAARNMHQLELAIQQPSLSLEEQKATLKALRKAQLHLLELTDPVTARQAAKVGPTRVIAGATDTNLFPFNLADFIHDDPNTFCEIDENIEDDDPDDPDDTDRLLH